MTNPYPDSVRFQQTDLTIIDRDGRPWVTAGDLSRALGYSEPRKAGQIYARNTDEFSSDMSLVLKLSTRGQFAPTRQRIFSPRGAHLIAMFARTDRAKAFRKWVLDVLEGLQAPMPQPDRIMDGQGIIRLGGRLVAFDANDTWFHPDQQYLTIDPDGLRQCHLHDIAREGRKGWHSFTGDQYSRSSTATTVVGRVIRTGDAA